MVTQKLDLEASGATASSSLEASRSSRFSNWEDASVMHGVKARAYNPLQSATKKNSTDVHQRYGASKID